LTIFAALAVALAFSVLLSAFDFFDVSIADSPLPVVLLE
jgi:hypothetical protein